MISANDPLPTTIQIGPDTLVLADTGEEWSLADDEPHFELRIRDWDSFDAAQCRPVDFRALFGSFDKSA